MSNFDIDPFVELLISPELYAAHFPNCDLLAADIELDGLNTDFYIVAFATCLVQGACS